MDVREWDIWTRVGEVDGPAYRDFLVTGTLYLPPRGIVFVIVGNDHTLRVHSASKCVIRTF